MHWHWHWHWRTPLHRLDAREPIVAFGRKQPDNRVMSDGLRIGISANGAHQKSAHRRPQQLSL